MAQENIRNVAIIAHVDHGKTTLVDQLLRQSGVFRTNESVAERVMDSGDLERERGITILAKNTAVMYNGVRINIVDTPGHADFGGEVERVLLMVDGVLLLVDALEGCMPQTRFVLKKALSLNKHPIVVINKMDRQGARADEVVDEILDLLIELGVTEEHLEFPVVYASAREGTASLTQDETGEDMRPLFDAILTHVPPPGGEVEAPLQLLVANIDYDDYLGRIGVGRIERGVMSSGQSVTVCKRDGSSRTARIVKLFRFEGLKRAETEQALAGDIVAFAGLGELFIGETVCDSEHIEPLPFVEIDEPTVSMRFMVNDSPFAGKEGKFVTSRHLRARLFREVETNISMRVDETDTTEAFVVSGRGELHLSILIETMRRQGYEFQVSRPQVIEKNMDGVRMEPFETLIEDAPEACVGVVMEKLGARKAEMQSMQGDAGYVRLEFRLPARSLMGYRGEFLTDTKGMGVFNHRFAGYEPYAGDLPERPRGSLVAHEAGETTTYGLYNAQERGRLFIGSGTPVYEGMIVGESAKGEDIVVNVCKKKHVTNMRASGSDEALRLTPPTELSLEQAMGFITDDEWIEMTPINMRMRKKVLQKELRLKGKKSEV